MADLVEAVRAALCAEQCLSVHRTGACVTPDGACLLQRPMSRVARAALSAIEAAGYRVVPMEPTEAMARAVRDPREANGSPLSKGFRDTWRAALAAAPKVQPAEAAD